MADNNINSKIHQLTDFAGNLMYPVVVPECIRFSDANGIVDMSGTTLVDEIKTSIENSLENISNDTPLNSFSVVGFGPMAANAGDKLCKIGKLDNNWFKVAGGTITINNDPSTGTINNYIAKPSPSSENGFLVYNNGEASCKGVINLRNDAKWLNEPSDPSVGFLYKNTDGDINLASSLGITKGVVNSSDTPYYLLGVDPGAHLSEGGGTITTAVLAKEEGQTNHAIYFKNYALYQTSDESLKEFISDVDVDLDNLALIKKGVFYWKDDPNKTPNIGVGANSVEALYPEIVDEANNLKTVSYDKLGVIALAAIDKLNAKIKALEKEVKILKESK